MEYRHHPTRDLWPVASSMSLQSKSSWHAQIKAWVRHPHDGRFPESACYQVLPSGNAAFAWRYWNERAAVRADGSHGRPLVSRVLVGPASILSPDVAVALSRSGPTAALLGMLPCEVPDGTQMPLVSGYAVATLANELAQELDEAAQQESGLQAIVAAALSSPSTPLGVSLQNGVIAKPLGQCVQCVLLWGLLRVAGPILGSAGRGWSFSTFEPPLGEANTAALPGIVFRQGQDTLSASGLNWRKEIKVRPLAPDALSGAAPYADLVELAGWLVAAYRDRGGKGLAAFLADACGSERSLYGRLERVQGRLRDEHTVVVTSEGSAYVALHARRSAHTAETGEAPRPAAASVPEPPHIPEPAEFSPVPEKTRLSDVAEAVDDPPEPAATPEAPDEVQVDQTVIVQRLETGLARQPPAESGLVRRQLVGRDPGDWTSEVRGGAAARREGGPDAQQEEGDSGQTAQVYYGYRTWTIEEVAPGRDGRAAPDLPLSDRADNIRWESQSGELADDDQQPRVDQPFSDSRQPYEQAGQPYPPQPYPQGQPAYSQEEQQRGNPYAQPGQPHYQQTPAQQPYPQPRPGVTVSSLLTQLELAVSDPERFRSCLDAIFKLRYLDDPEDRLKSWERISGKYWFANVAKCEVFQRYELAAIFSIVLIPELRRGGVREEAIANWALDAPAEMIAGLLAAVNEAEDQRPTIQAILTPALALRWLRDLSMEDLWDEGWPEAATQATRRTDKSRRWGIGRRRQ